MEPVKSTYCTALSRKISNCYFLFYPVLDSSPSIALWILFW